MQENTKKPRLTPPPGACDTHMHVYEKRFPIVPGAVVPPDAPVAAYRLVQQRLGIERVVDFEVLHSRGDSAGHVEVTVAENQCHQVVSDTPLPMHDVGIIVIVDSPL